MLLQTVFDVSAQGLELIKFVAVEIDSFTVEFVCT
jgi:hypothetical protein